MGAATGAAEVHLAEPFGRDVTELLFDDAGLRDVEQAGSVGGRQADGEMVHTGVVGRAGRRAVQGATVALGIHEIKAWQGAGPAGLGWAGLGWTRFM